MRTTVRLDDHLLATAKLRAAQRGVTLTRIIEDALRESLTREPTPQSRRSELPRLGDGELQPGVDLADNATLRDLLDDDCS
ncbi:MAG: ribbon-helix-helix domain-containing protein [Actinomycetota bacterium]|nr:ribbon-helix-helix domain-containing protein [Actinomycetota bacterium]